MRTVLIIFVLLGASNFTFAQSNDSLKTKKISITTSVFDYPFALFFNAYNYNLEISTIVKNRNTLHLGLGYINSFKPITNDDFLKVGIPTSISTKGYRVHLEGRHYLNKHKLFNLSTLFFWLNVFQYNSLKQNNTGYYVAFQNKYQYTKTKREEDIIDFISQGLFSETKHYKQNIYTVSRNTIGGYLKFGYNAIKKSGFTVDHAIGFGATYVSSSSKNKQGNDISKDFPYNKSFDNGSGIYFDLAYSFKIGWSF